MWCLTFALQVMGLMQGKVLGDTFVVIDSFALPVEGTETRVNAQVDGEDVLGGAPRSHAARCDAALPSRGSLQRMHYEPPPPNAPSATRDMLVPSSSDSFPVPLPHVNLPG